MRAPIHFRLNPDRSQSTRPRPQPRTQRIRRLAPGRSGPRRSAFDGGEFTRRAAEEARERQAAVLDVGFEVGGHQRLFEPDRYDSIVLAAPNFQRQFEDHDQHGQVFGSLPASTERYGLVLCTEVMGQAYDPHAVLAELNRVLERQGLLYVSSPLIVEPCGPRTGPRPARFGLNYLLEAAGFTLRDLSAYAVGNNYGVIAAKTRRLGFRDRSTP